MLILSRNSDSGIFYCDHGTLRYRSYKVWGRWSYPVARIRRHAFSIFAHAKEQ